MSIPVLLSVLLRGPPLPSKKEFNMRTVTIVWLPNINLSLYPKLASTQHFLIDPIPSEGADYEYK